MRRWEQGGEGESRGRKNVSTTQRWREEISEAAASLFPPPSHIQKVASLYHQRVQRERKWHADLKSNRKKLLGGPAEHGIDIQVCISEPLQKKKARRTASSVPICIYMYWERERARWKPRLVHSSDRQKIPPAATHGLFLSSFPYSCQLTEQCRR